MKLVKVKQLFEVKYGVNLELNKLDEVHKSSPNAINFVSRTRENNGVSAIVELLPDVEPIESGTISVAGSGNSVLYSFLQPEPYYSGRDLFYLKSKIEMSDKQKLFYCYCIMKNRFKYSYGRQANRTLSEILIPSLSDIPEDFLDIQVESPSLLSKTDKITSDIAPETWRWFSYKSIFNVQQGYYNKKPEKTDSGDIPFIGASMFNNGVTEYYSLFDIENNHKDSRSITHSINNKIFSGNCITIANNGAGVATAFYQPKDFTCSHDVNIIYRKDGEWNPYTAIFICTLIRMEKFRWAYGRKWRPSRIKYSKIKLPVKLDGKPDWDYMENYVKMLPYSENI